MAESDFDLDDPDELDSSALKEHMALYAECQPYIEKCREAGINLRGHFFTSKSSKSARARFEKQLKPLGLLSKSSFIKLLHDHMNGMRLDEPATFETLSGNECGKCGAEVVFAVTPEGFIANSGCLYPGDIPPITVKYNVPSGKLVFANDFRGLFKDVSVDYYVNFLHNIFKTTQAWADAGMIHVFVGNTCPGIYKVDDQNIRIISTAYDDETDEEIPPEEGERVGGIVTDLWWYSAADYDFLKNLVGEKRFKKITEDRYTTVVEVEPGCYTASSRHHLLDRDDWKSEELFSEIQRIGPVQELEPQSKNADTTERLQDFETAIKVARLSFPSIFPTRRAILEHYYCVIGNGHDWLNGTLTGGGDRAETALARLDAGEQVVFREEKKQREKSVYPLSENYSNLLTIPDDIKEDWLGGALEVFEWIATLDPETKSGGGHTNKASMDLAASELKRIEKRFPEWVARWRKNREEQDG